MTETPDRRTVRSARLEDAGPLRELYVELAEDRPGAQPPDEATLRGALERVLDQPDRHLLVAEAPLREVVGTLDVLIVPNLTHQARPWAVVENVVVAAKCRRQGFGRALMTEAIELARSAGCYKVQLHSGKQRAAEAHVFYGSLGFEAVAEGFKNFLDPPG
jgi:GNAT superfamily N-acetyltransferase